MKIIHCADLHLDSKMESNLDKEKAKQRRTEILDTFRRMIEYADGNGVSAILIAGDMFDKKNISAIARNTVLNHINVHPEINFYYLKGNHDIDNFLSGLDEIPANLRMFGSEWTSYEEAGGKISIKGLELSKENSGSAHLSLVLDSAKINIVMLHGQEAESASKDKTEIINLNGFRNKGIDYLALGHVHSYKKEKLDRRGTYCYPGCLEGRGFDECGEHGFVLLDINEDAGRVAPEFIPFAYRKLHTVDVDVTDLNSTAEMTEKARQALEDAGCRDTDLVKIVLTGQIDVECEKDIDHIKDSFDPYYYLVKVYDKTKLKINIEDYKLDKSLKGEFVRQVTDDESIPDEDKKIIIRYGLQAIAGEEVQ